MYQHQALTKADRQMENQFTGKKNKKKKEEEKHTYGQWQSAGKHQGRRKPQVNEKPPKDFATRETGTLSVKIPEIAVTNDVFHRIENFTHIAPGEFSLLGLVQEQKATDEDKVLRLLIDEVFFVEQTNTGGSSEIEDDALQKLTFQLIRRNNGDQSRLKAWIHSHADMGVFWSGTDRAQMARMRQHSEYFVSIVVNKAGKWKVRLDVVKFQHPFLEANEVHFDDLPYKVVYSEQPLFEECLKEYTEKSLESVCEVHRYQTKLPHEKSIYHRGGHQQGYNYWDAYDEGDFGGYNFEGGYSSINGCYRPEGSDPHMEPDSGDDEDDVDAEVTKLVENYLARYPAPIEEPVLSKENLNYHPNFVVTNEEFFEVADTDIWFLWLGLHYGVYEEYDYVVALDLLSDTFEQFGVCASITHVLDAKYIIGTVAILKKKLAEIETKGEEEK